MKLSIVIVNYNVEFFLEQCLYSVRRSLQGIDGEVFVVDNNSVDGSLKMLAKKFPEVKVIANKENVGFSRANNQAIRISTGEYVLLLNPDTVVEDDTFAKCIAFMDSHPDAGGLGVKMVDGKGNFLPESKRGLPTPAAAFYKMFGIAKLFPHNKRFAHYYMGHLSNEETNEVEILAGAFMLMRRETLDKVGLLDETFFMYGEDIDLSYRITQGGYKNYYFPETRIIHYKGESTKKTSVNYVLVFYKAMEIFAKKHFGQKRAFWFSFFINLAIYFKAFLALVSQFFHKIAIPFLDAVLGYAGLVVISYYWGKMTVYEGVGSYPMILFALVLPAYIFIWLISTYFAGGYDKPYNIGKAVLGVATGSVFVLVLYALLPESLRFSRALILFGTLWLALEMTMTRLIGVWMGKESFMSKRNAKKRFILIGSPDEAQRVEALIQSTSIKPDFIGLVSSDTNETPEGFIGRISQVPDIITIYKITEIIFCSKDVPHQVIIDKMVEWHASNVDYKIAPEDSLSIIGSNSINTRGDLYTVDIKAIDTVANRRNKRLLDVILSVFSIVFWLPLIFVVKKPWRFLKDAVLVLIGKRTWVGYCKADKEIQKLPKIRRGIYDPSTPIEKLGTENDTEFYNQLNLLYARDYTVWKDAEIFFTSLRADIH
ncbi:MAG: glycosyltransferase [Bacteroidales bacterium]|nr:glycosyltransferase [Bacteroidales bacterium]